MATVDGTLQGSARRITWTGAGTLRVVCTTEEAPTLAGVAPTTLHLQIRVHQLEGSVLWDGHALTEQLGGMCDGDWHTVSVPLTPGSERSLSAQGGVSLDIEAIYLTGA